ncbi:homoprotocatechuate degradation operon regulator HpaR [Ruegeria sp. HKCCD4884]|uniref:homoprotocatechuate degradation operon regulator HpaR n=1 Tax=Ruegeria sp. HKCCD4884 TaxID=2683022 RepID=UPI00353002C8
MCIFSDGFELSSENVKLSGALLILTGPFVVVTGFGVFTGTCGLLAKKLKFGDNFNMTEDLPLTSRSLPIALLRAREKVMGPIRAMLADAGVTEQQWRVLRVLNEEGPQEPTHLADRACLLLPSLTRILQKLEQRGLISRRSHPADRRRQIVKISASGVQVIRANLSVSIAQAERIRSQLGAEKHELLLDLLNDLKDLDP